MAIQKRNDELVSLLTPDFQKRYEPQFAWGNACAMIQQLTGLRGFWPMSAVDASGNVQDQSGHGHHLTYNGTIRFRQDTGTYGRTVAACARFDGTGDYLSRADEADLDVTGTEAFHVSQASVDGAAMGLTLGGWWRPEDAAASQPLIDKFSLAAGNYSYTLLLAGNAAGDPVRFAISDDGTNYDLVSSVTGYSLNTWQFVAGRFNDADTWEELAVWLNDEKTTATTDRNSIFGGTADLGVGGRAAGTYLYTGRAALVFLCGAALPDVTLWALYQQTRALFGV